MSATTAPRPVTKATLTRAQLLAGAAASLGLGVGAGFGGYAFARSSRGQAASVAPTPSPTVEPTPAVQTFVASGSAKRTDHLALPLQLVIPKIGVRAPVIAVGLTRDGAMDVPQRAGEIGWYQYGPRPGLKGNAVLTGHLDWYGEVGVFSRLADLVRGDAIAVRAADGAERTYAVEWREQWPVALAPIGRVFEEVDFPALTLITCGGRWDPVARTYDARVVVRCRRA